MNCTVSKKHPGALRLACVLAASLAAGCGGAEVDESPAAEEGREIDVERYDLVGEFDWDQNRLIATVTLTATLASDGPTTLLLDSAVTDVKAVRLAGGEALPFSRAPGSGRLAIDLSGVPALSSGGRLPREPLVLEPLVLEPLVLEPLVLEPLVLEPLVLEIDYEAAAGNALRATPARRGDTVAVRTVYTESEPFGAAQWMPCHNVPSDRAELSIALRMPEGESMIANGQLVSDTADGPSFHRVKYEAAYPLPTYLMAFASGDFEVERAMKGALPVSVWHRRGLPGDYDRLLAELSRSIGRFEELLVPYPFAQYALVLLPDFPVGGMENAGITFQRETSSTQPTLASDLVLSAHELGHQWFGDLVTPKSWDDLWIKEGMATLLEYEAARVYTDESGAGTLNGDELGPADGAAIRDEALAPEDKYTSGPYDRAAWLLTQIRSLAGEEAFWEALRGVLEAHRFGNVGTDEFLDAFAPALGADVVARAKRAVDAKAMPSLTVEPLPSGGAAVTLSDPDGALLAPLDVAWIAADGSRRAQGIEVGERAELAPRPGELLLVDPLDRHPDWTAFLPATGSHAAYSSSLAPLRRPTSAAQITALLDAGGAHQLAALSHGLPDVAPEGFGAFVHELDAESAKAVSISAACAAASLPDLDPKVHDAWAGVLTDVLSGPPHPFGLAYVGSYAACSGVVSPEAMFAGEWAELATGLASGGISDARLAYLSTFELPPAVALSTWGAVATQASSIRARVIATQRLRASAEELDEGLFPTWRAFFVGLLDGTDVTEILRVGIGALVKTGAEGAADNAVAIESLNRVLHSSVTRLVHANAVCAARQLTSTDDGAWTQFARGLDDAPLSDSAAHLVRSPADCR